MFTDYDCSKCRNCCKMYKGTIPKEDLEKNARHLEITEKQFVDFFLEEDQYGIQYQTKHKPCDFLREDGECKLGECRPDSCKKYPYTDQPERLHSLLGFMDIVSICPVAFEIYERLKKEYTLFQAPANLHGAIEIGESCWSIKRWLKRYQLPG